MTKEQVITAYREKYAAFPDLVERIVGQLKHERKNKEISIACFQVWDTTKEGGEFWNKLHRLERVGTLTRETIDAAYKEFGIEQPNKEQLGMHAALQLTDLRPLLLRHSDKEMVTKSCLHFLGDEAQEWWNKREENKTES